MDANAIADGIYEAAFNPDGWTDAIGKLSAVTRSDCGGLILLREARPIQCVATGSAQDVAEVFMADGGWKSCRSRPRFDKRPVAGFASSTSQDYYPPDVEANRSFQLERQLGLRFQAGAFMPMHTGEFTVFVLYRRRDQGGYAADEVRLLNHFHPHLARAAQISARLGLERARASVSTLDALGLPAAVLSASGRVLASNDRLGTIDHLFRSAAFGGVSLVDPAANLLLQEALAAAGAGEHSGVRSIPVADTEGGAPVVLHVLPLRRTAHDMFAGADVLVAATVANPTRLVPEPSLLMGLFDLTPSETKIALALTKGQSLREASDAAGIRFKSARTYLDRIFAKTGTNQQSQLVALLKTAHSF